MIILSILLLFSEEFFELSEEVKLYMEDAMQIEVAPLPKVYRVNFKGLYSELTLEKIDNQPTGPKHHAVRNYVDIFEDRNLSETEENNENKQTATQRKPLRKRSKKVLFQGNPVTFPQRAIQEFLGAHCLVKSFAEGESF